MSPFFAPFLRCVEQLARRAYSNELFTFKSLATFVLTTAPSYQEDSGHDQIGIVYNPESRLFGVDYCEWASATRNPPYRTAANRCCEWPEVMEVMDRCVLRLLLVRRERM